MERKQEKEIRDGTKTGEERLERERLEKEEQRKKEEKRREDEERTRMEEEKDLRKNENWKK